MSLASIQKGKRTLPRRVMLYGVHGIGKSTFGANAPVPIFLPTEDGIADIDCHSFPIAESYDEFVGYARDLATENHEYRTLVVDSIDWLERLIWHKVEADQKVSNIEDIGYGKGYQFALSYWAEVVKAFDWLRLNKSMHIVLIAHAKVEKFNNPETEAYDRYSPKLHKSASAYVQEWCDDVLFANYRTFTRSEDQGFNKSRTIAAGSGERVVRTTERPAHVAKNRCNLPDEIALDWRAYAEHAIKTETNEQW